MARAKIFVDSGAGFDHILFEQGIEIVPLEVIIDGGRKVYSDDKLPPEKLLEFLKSGRQVKTSQPSPQAYLKRFRRAKKQGYTEIVCITLPSSLSGSFNSARNAAAILREEGVEAHIFDSEMASMAQAFFGIKAAKAARQGAGGQEIINLLESVKGNIHIWAFLETSDYAIAGGRVTKKEVAELSTTGAIVTIRDGRPLLAESGIFLKDTINRILEKIKEATRPGLELEYVSVIHIGVPNRAGLLANGISSSFGFPLENIVISEVSSVLATHGGPGAFGVAFSTTKKG
jgi:DegV family protein with EDD domain